MFICLQRLKVIAYMGAHLATLDYNNVDETVKRNGIRHAANWFQWAIEQSVIASLKMSNEHWMMWCGAEHHKMCTKTHTHTFEEREKNNRNSDKYKSHINKNKLYVESVFFIAIQTFN